MEERAYKHLKPDMQKLLRYGFVERDSGFVYETGLVGGQMQMTVTVSQDGAVDTAVADTATGEEYVLHRVSGAAGAFVGQVKAEYEAVLEEIFAQCFYLNVFQSDQAKAVIAYAKETYGDALEFLWERSDNAILRRKDNAKWYAAFLTVPRRKLGSDSDEAVEILDLRMQPEDAEALIDNRKYFPGYHMNKKHWFTVCLDGSVPLAEIFNKVDASYTLAAKRK